MTYPVTARPLFQDKMKQKMSQLGDKIKETNFGIGNIKGLVKGYDNIDDNKKAGFHGFQSGGGVISLNTYTPALRRLCKIAQNSSD